MAGSAASPGRAQTPPEPAPRLDQITGISFGTTTHIRPADVVVARVLEDGRRRSPTFRALAEAIERSDVIVYVHRTAQPRHQSAGRVAAGLSFVGGLVARAIRPRGPGRAELPRDAHRGARHELRHALEVARAPEVRSREAFRALYRRIGLSTRGPGTNETEDAVRAGEIIWAELRGATPDTVIALTAGDTPDVLPKTVIDRSKTTVAAAHRFDNRSFRFSCLTSRCR